MGMGSEYQLLLDTVAELDPYFESLFVLRERLTQVFTDFFAEEPAVVPLGREDEPSS